MSPAAECDFRRLAHLRSDAVRALVHASPSMTVTLRDWLRGLPDVDDLFADIDLSDWADTLPCVRRGIEKLVGESGTSVDVARSYLRAYDLCAEAEALVKQSRAVGAKEAA